MCAEDSSLRIVEKLFSPFETLISPISCEKSEEIEPSQYPHLISPLISQDYPSESRQKNLLTTPPVNHTHKLANLLGAQPLINGSNELVSRQKMQCDAGFTPISCLPRAIIDTMSCRPDQQTSMSGVNFSSVAVPKGLIGTNWSPECIVIRSPKQNCLKSMRQVRDWCKSKRIYVQCVPPSLPHTRRKYSKFRKKVRQPKLVKRRFVSSPNLKNNNYGFNTFSRKRLQKISRTIYRYPTDNSRKSSSYWKERVCLLSSPRGCTRHIRKSWNGNLLFREKELTKVVHERTSRRSADSFIFISTKVNKPTCFSMSSSSSSPNRFSKDERGSEEGGAGYVSKPTTPTMGRNTTSSDLVRTTTQKMNTKKRKSMVFNFHASALANYSPTRRKSKIHRSSFEENASSSAVRLIDKILADPKHFDENTIDKKFEKKFHNLKSDGTLRLPTSTDWYSFDSSNMASGYSEIGSFKRRSRRKNVSREQRVSRSSSDSSSVSMDRQRCPNAPNLITSSSRCAKNRSRSLDTVNFPVNPTEASQRATLFRNDISRSSRKRSKKSTDPDGLTAKTKTIAILNRLDSVLSDLVEEEKRRIRYLEVKQRRKRDLSLDNLLNLRPKAAAEQNLKRPGSSQDSISKRLSQRHPTPADVMEQHKGWFTELKPHRPRILKSEVKAKLLSFRCYQKPKPKASPDTMTQDEEPKSQAEGIESCSSDKRATISTDDTDEKALSVLNSKVRTDEHLTSPENTRNPNGEEDDDTCYGSDMLTSEAVIESSPIRLRSCKQHDHHDGDFSIDSAYNGSREATPDLHPGKLSKKSNTKLHRISSELHHSGHPVSATNPGKRIEQGRSFLLREIKKMGVYSDKDINILLDQYTLKWSHVPERELHIIVRSIRRDLGVMVPPKECVTHLLSNSKTPLGGYEKGFVNILSRPSFSFSNKSSRTECIQALTKSLPFVSKRSERKTMQSFSEKSFDGIYEARHAKSSESVKDCSVLLVGDRLTLEDHTHEADELSSDDRSLPRPMPHNDTLPEQNQEMSDECWAKSLLGPNAYLVDEAKETVKNKTTSSDWNQVTEELCTQFDLHL